MKVISTVSTFLTSCALSICCTSAHASTINEIVFFGDSLTDNGNLYNHDFHAIPKSPPYFSGRFSNDHTWAEILGDHYNALYKTDIENYATGGATTYFHNPFEGFLPFTVGEEIDDYFLHELIKDRSHTLYFFWSGGNDYLPGSKNPDDTTTKVVNKTIEDLNSLIKNGAKNIVVMNMPDLGSTPRATETGDQQNLTDLTTLHNQKLAIAVAQLQKDHSDINIHIYDVYAMFRQAIGNLSDFNRQYGAHFTNDTQACWAGGYAANGNTDAAMISYQLQHDKQAPLSASKADALAKEVVNSPDLMEAYQVGQNFKDGQSPCDDPDDYIFWDHIHPTGEVHKILARSIAQFADKYYQFSS